MTMKLHRKVATVIAEQQVSKLNTSNFNVEI